MKSSTASAPPSPPGVVNRRPRGVSGHPRLLPQRTLAEIASTAMLTPGRYVGAEEVEDDDEAFADKMQS